MLNFFGHADQGRPCDSRLHFFLSLRIAIVAAVATAGWAISAVLGRSSFHPQDQQSEKCWQKLMENLWSDVVSMTFAGTVGIGAIALLGDVPSAITTFKTSVPWLVVPTKAIVAFPIVYHYAGGIRHLIWDQAKIGKQADKTSYLENETVDRLSWGIVGISLAGTLALSAVSFS